MKKRTFSLLVVLSVILLGGCYPDGPDYTEELDVVLTHNNPDYDFTAKGTYAMPDNIVKITGNVQEGQDPEYIPSATASQILARIATNMQNLGYTRVDVGADPDLLLTPASWETTTIYYYYDYWYGWYGGYYGGWGGYYPPVYASSYTTGTLVMMLIDPDDSELAGNGYPINQWTGALNGILTGKYSASRVNPLIDQAFAQSPYLKTN
jgi:hypothetical protein